MALINVKEFVGNIKTKANDIQVKREEAKLFKQETRIHSAYLKKQERRNISSGMSPAEAKIATCNAEKAFCENISKVYEK